MKQHKLVIEFLGEDGEYSQAYSKGHHDFITFKEAVAREMGCHVNEVCEPRHEWWRWNPTMDGQRASDYGYFGWQAEGTPGKRGSFPVTVCSVS